MRIDGDPAEVAAFVARIQEAGAPGPQAGGSPANQIVPESGGLSQLLIKPGLEFLTGDKNLQRIPSAKGGLTPADAFAAQNIYGVDWKRQSERAAEEFGKAFIEVAKKINNNVGLSQAIGVSPQELNKMLDDLGRGGVAGGVVANMLMNTPVAAQILGGSPLLAQGNLLASRGSFNRSFYDPFDTANVLATAKLTDDLGTSIRRRIFTEPGGKPGESLLPDLTFTRGMKIEDITKMISISAGKGRGTDYFKKLADPKSTGHEDAMREIEGMASTMQSLGRLFGSTDMEKLREALDKLTVGRWAQMDWTRMGEQVGRLSQVATMMNLTGDQMVNMMTTTRQSRRMAAGITPTEESLGLTAGAYEGLESMTRFTARVGERARRMGITAKDDPEGFQRLFTQEAGLDAITMNSKGGRSTSYIEYLATAGRITREDPLYKAYHQAMQSGDMDQALRIRNEILSSTVGLATGQADIESDETMKAIRSRTGADAVEENRRTEETMMLSRRSEAFKSLAQRKTELITEQARDVFRGQGQEGRPEGLRIGEATAIRTGMDKYLKDRAKTETDPNAKRQMEDLQAGATAIYEAEKQRALKEGRDEKDAEEMGVKAYKKYVERIVSPSDKRAMEAVVKENVADAVTQAALAGGVKASEARARAGAEATQGITLLENLGQEYGVDVKKVRTLSERLRNGEDPSRVLQDVNSVVKGIKREAIQRSVTSTMRVAGDQGVIDVQRLRKDTEQRAQDKKDGTAAGLVGFMAQKVADRLTPAEGQKEFNYNDLAQEIPQLDSVIQALPGMSKEQVIERLKAGDKEVAKKEAQALNDLNLRNQEALRSMGIMIEPGLRESVVVSPEMQKASEEFVKRAEEARKKAEKINKDYAESGRSAGGLAVKALTGEISLPEALGYKSTSNIGVVEAFSNVLNDKDLQAAGTKAITEKLGTVVEMAKAVGFDPAQFKDQLDTLAPMMESAPPEIKKQFEALRGIKPAAGSDTPGGKVMGALSTILNDKDLQKSGPKAVAKQMSELVSSAEKLGFDPAQFSKQLDVMEPFFKDAAPEVKEQFEKLRKLKPGASQKSGEKAAEAAGKAPTAAAESPAVSDLLTPFSVLDKYMPRIGEGPKGTLRKWDIQGVAAHPGAVKEK